MPNFCRHNRLIHNCPICAREQTLELRPLVSGGGRAERAARPNTPRRAAAPGSPSASTRAHGLRVRRLPRGQDDGYRSPLAPGLRSAADAQRLAAEATFAAARLERLATAPPDLYGEVAAPGDLEERTWLAFLIAYLCPLDAPDPFASVRQLRTSWASGDLPSPLRAEPGPRGVQHPGLTPRTLAAYRDWAQRAGSQASGFIGDPGWSAERRFARVFERLALPGLDRAPRFDLLVTLGWMGVYPLSPASLVLGGGDEVTLSAKRVFGIGDPLLLDRRAMTLAEAMEVPLAALDLGLHNWGADGRTNAGLEAGAGPAPDRLARARAALGLDPDPAG